jgi:hypothetical protein
LAQVTAYLLDLLVSNDVSVAAITKTEVPSALGAFNLAGYTSFLPTVAPGDKYRVMVYVRNDVAFASDAQLATYIMKDGLQAVWVRLDAHRGRPAMTIGGTYRKWSSRSTDGELDRSMPMQKEQLEALLQQVEAAASSSRSLIVLGDVNLDAAREEDKSAAPAGGAPGGHGQGRSHISQDGRDLPLTRSLRPFGGGDGNGLCHVGGDTPGSGENSTGSGPIEDASGDGQGIEVLRD